MGQLILVAIACLGLFVWSSTAAFAVLTRHPERVPQAVREFFASRQVSSSRVSRTFSLAIHFFVLALAQWLMGSVFVSSVVNGDLLAGLITGIEWLGAAAWTGYLVYSYRGASRLAVRGGETTTDAKGPDSAR